MKYTSVALMLTLTLAGPVQAGTVTVTYPAKAQYTDAGSTPWERDANLQELQNYLQGLGLKYLPADHQLSIDVLDVDLAGNLRSVPPHGDKRVVRGRSDWPRIAVRYTLSSSQGKVLQSAEETVSDMDYLHRMSDLKDQAPLRYEKRMLEQWFKQRFVSPGD